MWNDFRTLKYSVLYFYRMIKEIRRNNSQKLGDWVLTAFPYLSVTKVISFVRAKLRRKRLKSPTKKPPHLAEASCFHALRAYGTYHYYLITYRPFSQTAHVMVDPAGIEPNEQGMISPTPTPVAGPYNQCLQFTFDNLT